MTPKLRAPKGGPKDEACRDHALKGEQAFQGEQGPEKARDTTQRGSKQAARGKAGPSAGGAHKVRGTRRQEPPEPPGPPKQRVDALWGVCHKGGPPPQQLPAGAGRRAPAGREEGSTGPFSGAADAQPGKAREWAI